MIPVVPPPEPEVPFWVNVAEADFPFFEVTVNVQLRASSPVFLSHESTMSDLRPSPDAGSTLAQSSASPKSIVRFQAPDASTVTNWFDAFVPAVFSGMETDGSRSITVSSCVSQEKTVNRIAAEAAISLNGLFGSNVCYF